MNQKENITNKSRYNQISQKGLLENNKKLLINKFHFFNLSYSNLNIENNLSNKNFSLNSYSLQSLKNDIKRPINASSNNKSKSIQNIDTALKKKNSNKNCIIKNYQISSNSLKKNNSKKILLNRNNKSMAILPTSPILNINGMSNYSLKKINKILHNEKSNLNISSINTGTAQNSIKTNQNTFSNHDLLEISPKLKPIRKNKNKQLPKIENNNSTSNLLINLKNPINVKKEKPYKIFEKNLCDENKKIIEPNNNKAKYIIESPIKINKNIKNIQKVNRNSKIAKKNQKINTSSLEKLNINNKRENKSENKSAKMKYIATGSNENSDATKKESRLDFQKLLNDKILNNLEKKNIINGIISYNLKNININTKNLTRNNNNQSINEQITINIENNINNNFKNEEDQNINMKNEKEEDFKNISTQKLSLTHIDTHIKNEHNIFRDNSNNSNKNNDKQSMDNNIYDCEDDEKDEKINYNHNNDKKIKEINYSDINNENINNNYLYNNKEENSSIQTHKNIYKKLYDLNNIKEMNKQEEQEMQGEPDIKSVQTQTTVDKNNIISKFIKQPIYNISPRFLSNEVSLNTKHILPEKSFMFINEIENENKKLPVLNYKKILNLKERCIYNLLSYSYDNYNSIISLNKLVKNKINKSLKNIFSHVIDDFKSKYNKFLEVLDYSFNTKEFTFNHKKNITFNLEMKCKIITKEIKKSFEIGCDYVSFNKVYDYIWKFDVQKKEDIKLWLCTELDIINNSYKKFSYTSQVSSFCYNDEIILQFNIFSKGNNIEVESIEWIDPVESFAPIDVYQRTNFIPSIDFDQLRACEVETQIVFWKRNIPDNDYTIIEEFKKIFKSNFDIKNISYDVSKFYFYKIEMMANKIGLVKQNKFSTFDINIIDSRLNIQNEIQCLYLINSNYYSQKMDIRLGTNLILYIVDMKR